MIFTFTYCKNDIHNIYFDWKLNPVLTESIVLEPCIHFPIDRIVSESYQYRIGISSPDSLIFSSLSFLLVVGKHNSALLTRKLKRKCQRLLLLLIVQRSQLYAEFKCHTRRFAYHVRNLIWYYIYFCYRYINMWLKIGTVHYMIMLVLPKKHFFKIF